MIPLWLTSPAWASVVKALLHTLWQGTIIAVLLALALRRLANPVFRYRCTLAALCATVGAGLLTWGVLNRPLAANPPKAAHLSTAAPAEPPMAQSDLPALVATPAPDQPLALTPCWTAWLALLWLAGAGTMLVRAGFQVAGAENLRRSSHPLDDPHVAVLLEEARRAVNLTRRVRLAVTDQLASPVVAGVLAPTLILPLTLTTTLTPEQIRFIFLHELAHIQRGDYLANLFQLFAEALLFFNPAVWWISRQMRLEREACCDALAVELSGAPGDYARTLVRVVENIIRPAPAATPALGGRREPSSLADRVQRMLVPGYRPALRLTWRAMFAALLTGGALLFLSALGTRVTIAAFLTPQERIERIEKKMTAYGQNPALPGADNGPGARVKIAGHLRMADGSPVPQWVPLNIYSTRPRASCLSSARAMDGQFSESIQTGAIYIGAETTNFAPAVLGPLDGFATNDFENLELVLAPGFDVPVRVVDAASGQALAGGVIAAIFAISGQDFHPHILTLDTNGSATLAHAADLPVDLTPNVPGYEIAQKHFDHLQAGETLRVALRRGQTFSGRVLDRATGRPLAGAEFHLLYQAGADNPGRYGWDDPRYVLGQSGADGAFSLNQLESGYRYYFGVSAPGHESIILEDMVAPSHDRIVRLGPELIVRGHVTGNLAALGKMNGNPMLVADQTEVYDNNSWGNSQWVPLQVVNGVGTFQFTNRTAGQVTLSGAGWREERDITAPIDDWKVNLRPAAATNALPRREVIFRFISKSQASPGGTVAVTIPDNLDPAQLTAHEQEMGITNGEVRAMIPIGGQTEIEPSHMVGYWFDRWKVGGEGQSVIVTSGEGPLIVNIPLIPAGAIYAKAQNADGTPAGGLFFEVSELKRAPGRGESSSLNTGGDGFSDSAPRQWVSGPLPLGGTYQVHAWRGNAFCGSQPIKLTEANPDAEVSLQFGAGTTYHGKILGADGDPVVNAKVNGFFILPDNHEFSLKPVLTDSQGRFTLENTTPEIGAYKVEVDAPGQMAERLKLDFGSQPQTFPLQRGRTLGGRIVEAGNGLPLPFVAVRAWSGDGSGPQPSMKTDADGRFMFTTFGEGEYTLYTDAGQMVSNEKYRADGNTNLTLEVKLYPWSKVKPQASAAQADPPAHPAAEVPKTAEQEAPAGGGPKEITPQVFISAEYYELPDQTFNQLVSPLPFTPGDANRDGWWLVAPEAFTQFQANLKRTGLTPLDRPRVQTLSGKEADFFVGNEINGTSLNCLPTVKGARMNLAVNGMTVESRNGRMLTNQFNVNADLPNRGGMIIRAQSPSGTDTRNVAVVVSVKILTNGSPAQLQQRLVRTNNVFYFQRTFKVSANAFLSYLRQQGSGADAVAFASNPGATIRKLIAGAGVDSKSTQRFFYNNVLGTLYVTATDSDLDKIEKVLSEVAQAEPQIHIQARFFQAPKGVIEGFGKYLEGTNMSAWPALTGILSRQNAGTVMPALQAQKDVEVLGEPEATMTSGRRVEMRSTHTQSAPPGQPFFFLMDIGSDSILLATNSVEMGPVLNAVPNLMADGYTIQLAADPSCNEFVGYQPKPEFRVWHSQATVNLWDGQTLVMSLQEPAPAKSAPSGATLSPKEILAFVTVTLVDVKGRRVHNDDQPPFATGSIPPLLPSSSLPH